jgi:succinoglycan biosynthesis transport protein ExoP
LIRIFRNGNGKQSQSYSRVGDGHTPREFAHVPGMVADRNCDTHSGRQSLIALTGPESMIFSAADVRGPADESLRVLAHRLRRMSEKRRMKAIVVTSAAPREGKTVVAVNLAATLASSSARVALVDGDLRSASVGRMLGVPAVPGLAECIEDSRVPKDLILPVTPLKLDLLQAGAARRSPAELLQSPAFSGVIKSIAESYDWVIVDSPPLTPFVDANCLASAADAVLVVVRAGVTSRESVTHTIEALSEVHVAGIVLNADDTPQSSYYAYYPRYQAKPPLTTSAAVRDGRSSDD